MPTAVNIALILPEDWNQEARRLNTLLEKQPNPVPLAKGQAVPHITLAMGVLEESQVQKIPNRLRTLFADELRVKLTPQQTYLRLEQGDMYVSGVAIEKNDALQRLHEGALELLLDLGTEIPTMGSIAGGPDGVDPVTLSLIDHFRQFGVYGDYFPHITLGVGGLTEGTEFRGGPQTVSFLGVFTLGNLCTCRDELFRLDLANNHDVASGGFRGGFRVEG